MKIKTISGALVIAAAALIAGCIVTGTVVITAKVVPDPDPVTITETSFTNGEMEINLTEEDEFEEYKDDIKNIDNIGFYLSARNNQSTSVNFQLLIEPDTSANWASVQDAIDHGIDIILTGLTIGGYETVVIDWNGSIKYVSDAEEIKDIIESGVFSIYPAAVPREDFSVTIDSLVVVVTLTGGK